MANDDLALYRAQTFGATVGIGARPALCIVDFVNGFTDPAVFGGGNIKAAVTNTIGLLATARRRTLPIAFSRGVFAKEGKHDCVFVHKVPALAKLTEDAFVGQIVPELPPLANETILRKTQPSAFFGTGYAQLTRPQGVVTVVVAGFTLAGCVRANVVDSMSNDFRT